MRSIRWFLPTILLALPLAAMASAEEGPHWEANLEVAKQIAAQSNRLVLVHFWAPWCGPCMRLESNVFTQPGVGPAMEARYVPVKVNAQEWPATARLYGLQFFPCDVIMTPNGRVLNKLSCPQDPRQYVAQLNQAASIAAGAIAGGPGAETKMAAVQAPSVPANPANDNLLRPRASVEPSKPAGGMASIYSEDQYSEFKGRNTPPATSIAAAPAATPSSAGSPPAAGDNVFMAPPAQRRPAANAFAAGPDAAMTASYRQTLNVGPKSTHDRAGGGLLKAETRGGAPARVGLEGYCPVTLVERSSVSPTDPRAWTHGDPRWGAVHRGTTYLFVGPEEQKRFLQNPDRYSPALSGNDAVLAFDRGQLKVGSREFGIYFENRIYLFCDAGSLEQFSKNPRHYAEEARRAENPQQVTIR